MHQHAPNATLPATSVHHTTASTSTSAFARCCHASPNGSPYLTCLTSRRGGRKRGHPSPWPRHHPPYAEMHRRKRVEPRSRQCTDSTFPSHRLPVYRWRFRCGLPEVPDRRAFAEPGVGLAGRRGSPRAMTRGSPPAECRFVDALRSDVPREDFTTLWSPRRRSPPGRQPHFAAPVVHRVQRLPQAPVICSRGTRPAPCPGPSTAFGLRPRLRLSQCRPDVVQQRCPLERCRPRLSGGARPRGRCPALWRRRWRRTRLVGYGATSW